MLLHTARRLGACGRVNFGAFTRMMSGAPRRHAVKIVNAEEIEANEQNQKPSSPRGKSKAPPSRLISDVLKEEKLGLNKEEDVEPQSPNHPRVAKHENDIKFSKYMVIVKSRKRRRTTGLILLEGKKLINDALMSGIHLEALFVSRRKDLANLTLPPAGYLLAFMPYKYFEKWTDTVTPPGVCAIFKIPDHLNTTPDPKGIPLTVICDNIRDPGNMGAILRVLAGVGCKQIFVTKGCVDIWEPKVLRAACGAHFRVPIDYDKEWKDLIENIDDNASVFLADCHQPSEKATNSNLETDETYSSDQDDLKTDKTSSSDQDDLKTDEMSSSNQDDLKTDETSSSNQDNTSTSVDSNNPLLASPSNDTYIATSTKSHETVLSQPYYDMKFQNKSNILVVSNESAGVSKQALAFVSDRNGFKVYIPLCGEVESLNVVSALSVIAFEMKRQAHSFKAT